jgi:hypothetical protein
MGRIVSHVMQIPQTRGRVASVLYFRQAAAGGQRAGDYFLSPSARSSAQGRLDDGGFGDLGDAGDSDLFCTLVGKGKMSPADGLQF